jgi:hypothetical protein
MVRAGVVHVQRMAFRATFLPDALALGDFPRVLRLRHPCQQQQAQGKSTNKHGRFHNLMCVFCSYIAYTQGRGKWIQLVAEPS